MERGLQSQETDSQILEWILNQSRACLPSIRKFIKEKALRETHSVGSSVRRTLMIEMCMQLSRLKRSCSRRCKPRLSRSKKRSRRIWPNYIAIRRKLSNRNTSRCKLPDRTQPEYRVTKWKLSHLQWIFKAHNVVMSTLKITANLMKDLSKVATCHPLQEYLIK